MKIAVCYNGVLGKHNNSLKNFINNKTLTSYQFPDADVFCHLWTDDENIKKIVINKLNPKDYIFEKQIKFEVPRLTKKGWENLDKITQNDHFFHFNQISSAYSVKQTLTLKKEYEKKHNFKYDVVIICRYDISVTNLTLHPLMPHIDRIIFCEKAKREKKQPHEAIGRVRDYLFFSNSENMDKYATLYDKLDEYRYIFGLYHNKGRFCPHLFKPYHIQQLKLAVRPAWKFIHSLQVIIHR
tara:strand:- start:2070 stop:2789 length:720 start_codon:yes stop_codon:yes gene_type:complete